MARRSASVRDLMTKDVRACSREDTLADAARQMWDGDCGCIPVVADDRRLAGIVTDRDACMAASMRGAALHDIHVGEIMSSDVVMVGPEDSLSTALERMGSARVRRLPVVDEGRRLVGILSLNDLARASASGRVSPEELSRAMAHICEPHELAHADSH